MIVLVAAVVSLGALGSCARVQEACGVVAEADSLRAVGQAFTDSVAIANAAEMLYPLRFVYPTEYAHANYYYGRLLRERGDHPAAMEAFLRTVHSRTRDYAIKGRAYSNMGTLCNWANEFELSYTMYLKCSEQFIQAHDSMMYFYSLNAMALQLAEIKRYSEAITLLDKIEEECSDSAIITKTWETKAFLYFNVNQYDSVIYAVNQLDKRGYRESAGYVKKAQAFWHLSQYDSALVCANAVMAMPYATDPDRYNMLYILTYSDSTIDEALIRQRTEERADIDKEKLDPLSLQYAQAAQLLKQDLNRKPDLRWVIAIIVTSIVIGIGIAVYVRKRKRQHQLYSQKVAAAQETHRTLSEQNQQLVEQRTQHHEKALAEIETFCQSITEDNIKRELCWKDFDGMCAIVNRRMYGLVDKLKAKGITSDTEIRICVVVAIGKFTTKQMVDIVSSSYDSFKTTKSLAAKKLQTTGKNMRSSLLKLAVGC